MDELYASYGELKQKMNNPDVLHEGDVLEGKFILNSLHHIIDEKGI